MVKVPGAAGHALRQSKLFHAFAMATPGHARAALHGQALGARPARAPHERRGAVRPGDRRRSRLRPRRRDPAHAAHVRGDRQGRPDRQPGADDRAARSPIPTFTAVVAVSTPEEMPVNETLELRDALAAAPDPLELQAVILNGRYPDRFTSAEPATLVAALARASDSTAARGRSMSRWPSTGAPRSSSEQEQRLRERVRRAAAGAALPVRAAAGARRSWSCWPRNCVVTRSRERAAAAGGQAHLHLRRCRRRRQDHDLCGDRRRDGGARAQGRGRHDRSRQAPGERARARAARQRAAPGLPCDVSRVSRSAASCGR